VLRGSDRDELLHCGERDTVPTPRTLAHILLDEARHRNEIYSLTFTAATAHTPQPTAAAARSMASRLRSMSLAHHLKTSPAAADTAVIAEVADELAGLLESPLASLHEAYVGGPVAW